MSLDLEKFIEETKLELDFFRSFWLEEHKKNPKDFPLSLDEDNAGLWFEQFSMWDSSRMEDKTVVSNDGDSNE